MKDLAFHLTDIVENSIRAGAGEIGIRLRCVGREFRMRIDDNGCGMDAETLERAVNPFFTTRTTRKMGLGLPFLFQNAEQCGGSAGVRSRPGRGTVVKARFPLDHIDCPPAGDLAGTLMQLIVGNPGVNIRIRLDCGRRSAGLATREIADALEGLPLGHPRVALHIRELLASLLEEVFRGRLI